MSETAAQRDPAMFGQLDYERRHAEAYFTEPWITETLCRQILPPWPIWEPAAGRGDMAKVLRKHASPSNHVIQTDLHDYGGNLVSTGVNFLDERRPRGGVRSIVTNPPFANGMAEKFCRHALSLMNHPQGMVCMLLRHEFDCAGTRSDLFTKWPFCMKLTLTKRPRWDWWEREKPQSSPRHNFAWYIWDFKHEGPATLAWGPK